MTSRIIRDYVTDVKASLRLSDRNSKGQFVPGNKYRFRKTKINVNGQPGTFLAQSDLVGSFFKAL